MMNKEMCHQVLTLLIARLNNNELQLCCNSNIEINL